MAVQILAPLCDVYLPWSNWSLRPAAIVTVLTEMLVHRRRNVVELGSGVSTVYLSAFLRQTAGKIHAVEHDSDWARVVVDRLEAAGLSDHGEVIQAPLEHNELALDATTWYASDALAPLSDDPIDVLLVDGPPGGPDRPLSRYPAVPFFLDALSPIALVVLDDLERPGEQEILSRWEAESDLRFERLPHLRIAMASRAGTPIHL
jgi:predicted O-methyltransferase YrrM